MAKRYLGGGISFEQKDVYQEFSEDETPSPGGSSSLVGLTDVDISNPTDGQTLVYDASSEKWVNGDSAGGALMVSVVEDDQGNAILMTPAGEIYAAFANGKNVRVVMEVEGVGVIGAFSLLSCDIDTETSAMTFNVTGLSGMPWSFYAATDEDYPSTDSTD